MAQGTDHLRWSEDLEFRRHQAIWEAVWLEIWDVVTEHGFVSERKLSDLVLVQCFSAQLELLNTWQDSHHVSFFSPARNLKPPIDLVAYLCIPESAWCEETSAMAPSMLHQKEILGNVPHYVARLQRTSPQDLHICRSRSSLHRTHAETWGHNQHNLKH